MSALSRFNPETDHYVTAFLRELPGPGAVHTVIVNDIPREEYVLASWWTDEPQRDPLIGNRRCAALITRSVST